ncbi:hypothetical protein ACWF94_40315, partial [Streptomyces sp. NPDC055078]
MRRPRGRTQQVPVHGLVEVQPRLPVTRTYRGAHRQASPLADRLEGRVPVAGDCPPYRVPGHPRGGRTVRFTGLPGSGKSSAAAAPASRLTGPAQVLEVCVRRDVKVGRYAKANAGQITGTAGMTGTTGTTGVDDPHEPPEAPRAPEPPEAPKAPEPPKLRLRTDRHGLGECVAGLLGLLRG